MRVQGSRDQPIFLRCLLQHLRHHTTQLEKKEKITPFSISLVRSQVLYQAAQVPILTLGPTLQL